MKSKAVRVALLCLFVVASGGAAYVLWTNEILARRDAQALRQFDTKSFSIERDVLELRAAQRAYVAAGQGEDFWISNAAAAILRVRAALESLRTDAISPEAQASIDNAASALEDFERVDRRARDYARRDDRLLASDLIFADGLESTGAMLASLQAARGDETGARDAAVSRGRRAELIALGAAAFVSASVIALLVPHPRREDQQASAAATASPGATLDLRPPTISTPSTPRPKPPVPEARPSAPALDFRSVASLCTDLAKVTDTRALPDMLGRAATVLDAPGIVLWIADPDGRELSPIVTHGYSQKMVTRLGTILKDDENVTASAFRTSLLQTVDTDAVSNGAIAAPLVTPAGCVGVMAAEVRDRGEKDSGKLAAATIVAAQLATLVGPPSTRAQARADAG
jgi:hypothetical protein